MNPQNKKFIKKVTLSHKENIANSQQKWEQHAKKTSEYYVLYSTKTYIRSLLFSRKRSHLVDSTNAFRPANISPHPDVTFFSPF